MYPDLNKALEEKLENASSVAAALEEELAALREEKSPDMRKFNKVQIGSFWTR